MKMTSNSEKSPSGRAGKNDISNPAKTDEKAIIMSGYGINSEMETQEAFTRAGMGSDIVHINDLIAGRKKLSDYRLLVFPAVFLMVTIPAPVTHMQTGCEITCGTTWRNF